MALFTVTHIINGNTIKVQPGWTWNNVNGDLVQIKGYNVSPAYTTLAIHRLNTLLINKQVELKNAVSTNLTINGNEVVCSVYLNGIDISQYFPELKTT